jgi:hypothetical protein
MSRDWASGVPSTYFIEASFSKDSGCNLTADGKTLSSFVAHAALMPFLLTRISESTHNLFVSTFCHTQRQYISYIDGGGLSTGSS